MFSGFFYTLREHEMNVSLTEWLILLEALDKGLAKSSLTEFYYLSRAILAKTEKDFDNFDTAFLHYFQDIQNLGYISKEFLSALDGEGVPPRLHPERRRDPGASSNDSRDDNEAMIQQDAPLQNEAIDAAIDGPGPLAFHDGGMNLAGTQMAGSVFDLAGARTFRDFRDDTVINERQFQVVLRRLRQLSNHADVPESELDIDNTIRRTSDKGGILHVAMKKPRRNIVKLLLLIDSGGSMQAYSKFCTALFQAAMKSNSFQDLKIYYFHNCIYNKLYTDPTCGKEAAKDSEWVLNNISSDYRVIIVGDAAMAPAEIATANYHAKPGEPSLTGMEWMLRFKKKYPKIVWLNPEDERFVWRDLYTRQWFAGMFDMYLFTLRNFEAAMKKLLSG